MLRPMGAPRIAASPTAVPPYRWDQAALLQLSGYEGQRAGFFSNSQIDGRYLYLDPATLTPQQSADQLTEPSHRRATPAAARRAGASPSSAFGSSAAPSRSAPPRCAPSARGRGGRRATSTSS